MASWRNTEANPLDNLPAHLQPEAKPEPCGECSACLSSTSVPRCRTVEAWDAERTQWRTAHGVGALQLYLHDFDRGPHGLRNRDGAP